MTPEQEAVEALAIPEDADRGRVTRVVWTDSGQSLHGWQQMSDVRTHAMPVIESVGLWMGESESLIMLAGSHDPVNCNWSECQLIWKPAITSKEFLS